MRCFNSIFICGIVLCVFGGCNHSEAETKTESYDIEKAKKCVEDFFDAFHQKDTNSLRTLLHSSVVIKTVTQNASNETEVVEESVLDMLQAIASIPDEMEFEEKLHAFKIESDGILAHIWTPYSFYVNQNLSHSGVNSFTLVNTHTGFKIIHLIDTRYRK
jgi:hypothetical protein